MKMKSNLATKNKFKPQHYLQIMNPDQRLENNPHGDFSKH